VEGLWESWPVTTPAFLTHFTHFLFSAQVGILILGVGVSYLVVMVLMISRETTHRQSLVALNKLNEVISDAKEYHGFSVMPVTEWFDPSIQVYLVGELINRK
jgi:hypothetical protein